MRTIIVGLGVQGKKRQHHAGQDFVASVDTINKDAHYRSIQDVPIASFDTALVCLPDQPKFDVLRYLLEHEKHVLVEKPLWTETDEQIQTLQRIAQQNNVTCYTAYNHRFEPHFIRMKEVIDSNCLGRIYYCRLFYGNGTARLVRNSTWRDQGTGVLADLGSHLLDTVHFWFSKQPSYLDVVSINHFENKAPDHVVLKNQDMAPQLTFEMSLLSWRNHFVCDVVAEHGSAHIESLCKWGPSTFTHRQRVLPSGRPPEECVTLVQDDPTWALEYQHFKQLILRNVPCDLTKDLWIQQELNRLSDTYLRSKSAATLSKHQQSSMESLS